MNNKYVMTRSRNVTFLRDNLVRYLYNCLLLSRYEVTMEEIPALLENNPMESEMQIALANFKEAFDYICENEETADYETLLTLHKMLMKGLNDEVKSVLSDEQIEELNTMINQPAKANTEIAIDAMLFILINKLFSDGDVRVSLMFANKILVDNGNGVITVAPENDATFRQKMKEFREGDSDFKEWIYRYCVQGVRIDY